MTRNQPSTPGDRFVPARCAWEVSAGLIPGQPIPEHTRRFGLTSREWAEGEGAHLFLDRMGAAMAYAMSLQHPNQLNWVRLDWVWF